MSILEETVREMEAAERERVRMIIRRITHAPIGVDVSRFAEDVLIEELRKERMGTRNPPQPQ